MSDKFKVNIIYNNEKPSFQSVMNRLYIDYLKTNLETIIEESYNNKDKLPKAKEEIC